MSDESERLKGRLDQFVLDVLALIKTLPASEPGPLVRRQLAKSSTSQAANYRASRRARSHAEFTARIGVVAEEADETLYWLSLCEKARLTTAPSLSRLLLEANEFAAIFSAMVGTARRNERAGPRR